MSSPRLGGKIEWGIVLLVERPLEPNHAERPGRPSVRFYEEREGTRPGLPMPEAEAPRVG